MSETTPSSKPTRRQAALDRLNELEKKYFDLVWFVISHNDDCQELFMGTEEAELWTKNERSRIRELYPDETDELSCPTKRTWAHGFNSGILACVRLLSGYLIPQKTAEKWDSVIEMEERDFPALYV